MASNTDADKTIVLVTGSNQGIGLEIVRKLAKENPNYHVFLTGRRREAVEAAAATLQAEGLSAVEPLLLDVASDESIAAAAKAVDDRFGRLDVLINNSAIVGGDLEEAYRKRNAVVPIREMLHHVYNTNVFGVAATTDAFIPLLKRGKAGPHRIVFVTSTLGSIQRKADPNDGTHKADWVPYSSSKSALNMLALHYAARYEDDKIWKFNVCCPGYCGTNLNGYAGHDTPAQGAIIACRLATDGMDGPTGTFSNRDETIPW